MTFWRLVEPGQDTDQIHCLFQELAYSLNDEIGVYPIQPTTINKRPPSPSNYYKTTEGFGEKREIQEHYGTFRMRCLKYKLLSLEVYEALRFFICIVYICFLITSIKRF